MNRFSAISVIRPLVGCANGSRCRTNIVAHPVAGVVKLTAVVADGVSVIRWPAGGGRNMNTAGGGVTEKKDTDTDVRCEKNDTDDWESFQKELIDEPDYRDEEEMRTIFERWSAHFGKRYATEEEKKRRFGTFKKKLKHIDFQNGNGLGNKAVAKVLLDVYCDLTAREFLTGLRNRKFCVESIRQLDMYDTCKTKQL